MRNARRKVSYAAGLCLVAIGFGQAALSQVTAAEPTSSVRSPQFEVVVIHPTPPDVTNWKMEFNPGTMHAQNRSVRDLVEFAYDLKSSAQLLNAPGWISSQHFDIEGKEDEVLGKTLETCPLEQRRQLMRQLVLAVLEERFQLQVVQKTAEIPVFALVVAKTGPKVRTANAADGQTFRGLVGPAGRIDARGATMQLLADRLARTPEAAGRVVLDKTQMRGEYSWSLRWTPESASTNTVSEDEAAPSLFTALQEQLGLKLESRKSEVPAISIAHVQQPSGN